MTGLPLAITGWIGVGAFFVRFLVQWIASERARRPTTPPAFWWISLAGSLSLGNYCFWRGEYVLLVGILLNGAIYGRNLVLAKRRETKEAPPLPVLIALTAGAVVLLTWCAAHQVVTSADEKTVWLLCALVGQAAWSARFVVPWWLAERRGTPELSASFWWASLAGNVLLLSYAVHLWDAVLVASYLLGPLVQVRNLMLGARSRRTGAPQAAGLSSPSSPRDRVAG